MLATEALAAESERQRERCPDCWLQQNGMALQSVDQLTIPQLKCMTI